MFNIIIAIIISLLLLPLAVIIAILILIDSRGPIIYKHIRVGINGKKFVFYKFRTMVVNAEINGPVLPTKSDLRCTRVGVFLRNSYLDELPQLINIIKGEMVFVGPRPERPYFHKIFRDKYPGWEKRLQVLPGITGWAQVHNITSHTPAKKLKYDLEYIQKKSFWLDTKIIFCSFHYLFGLRAKIISQSRGNKSN